MNGDNGFVLLHRTLIGHPAFRTDAEAMAFAWLVLRASWRPTRVRYKEQTISLARGQLAISLRDMAAALDRQKGWVERLFFRLKNETMIETQAGTGVTIVTICNYDKYQPSTDRGRTGAGQEKGQGQDRGRTQNNEGNKGNKESLLPPTPFELPASIPADAWSGFEEMRIKAKKPLTDRARKSIVKKLLAFSDTGQPPGDVLDQSTRNTWTDVYELKGNGNGKNYGNNRGGGARAGQPLNGFRSALREAEAAAARRDDPDD